MSVKESLFSAKLRPVPSVADKHGPRGAFFPFSNIEDVPCFTEGTCVATPNGAVPIEALNIGDLILTRDHGPQRLRWIGRTIAAGRGTRAPVAIATGALGNTAPLILSPDHRVLLTGWRCAMVAGTPEIFAAAKDLVNERDITRLTCKEITYYHLAFDQHEIVCTSGLLSESFHPETMAPHAMTARSRAHLIATFPSLGLSAKTYGPHARPQVQSYEARLLRP